MRSSWFKDITGFDEIDAENVWSKLQVVNQTKIYSKINRRTVEAGTLEVISLSDLRSRIDLEAEQANVGGRNCIATTNATGNICSNNAPSITISEVVGNVQHYILDETHKHSLFQVASQFNLLEMPSPVATPSDGITAYSSDRTQGPACSIACGAGTIYRNYFVPIEIETDDGTGDIIQEFGQINNQINCLGMMEEYFLRKGFTEKQLWTMSNGYCFFTSKKALKDISNHIIRLSSQEYEDLKGSLQVGIHWDTEVTLHDSGHLVSQIFCAAPPVAYSDIGSAYWEPFARIILEATYESTLYAALLNYKSRPGGSNKVFLTLVGGGVFGNEMIWIEESISKAIDKFRMTELDIVFISYSRKNRSVRKIISDFNRKRRAY